jgi:hypothetical protein
VCHMVIEAFRREHAMDPVWRIPERLEMHMQRLHKAFPDCVHVPYALRELLVRQTLPPAHSDDTVREYL